MDSERDSVCLSVSLSLSLSLSLSRALPDDTPIHVTRNRPRLLYRILSRGKQQFKEASNKSQGGVAATRLDIRLCILGTLVVVFLRRSDERVSGLSSKLEAELLDHEFHHHCLLLQVVHDLE